MSFTGRITLLRRWMGMLLGKSRVATEQKSGELYSRQDIKGYYNDLTGKVNDQTLLDEQGIPINIIANNKKVHFPISIFQYGLGLYDLYLREENEKYKEHFFEICKWIIANQRKDGSWDCFGPIGYSKYSISSMGQGEAISVLARAYKCSGEEQWKQAAKKAIAFMIMEVAQGGTLLIEGNDYYFEEYVSERSDKRSVLNGWIFSLFGIYDYMKLEKNETIKDIYEKSIETLKNHLLDYDIGYWSLYDKSGRIASPAYHDLHISLLITLSDLTGEEYFKQIADKWQSYTISKVNKCRALFKKILQKLKESPEGVIIQ